MTIPPDEYLMKSLRAMNTLYKSILKFDTANRLFKKIKKSNHWIKKAL